jgi:hypothetical protein
VGEGDGNTSSRRRRFQEYASRHAIQPAGPPAESSVSFFRHGVSVVNCVPFCSPACPFDRSVNWIDGASGIVEQAHGERSYEYDRWNLGTYVLSAQAQIFLGMGRQ